MLSLSMMKIMLALIATSAAAAGVNEMMLAGVANRVIRLAGPDLAKVTPPRQSRSPKCS